MKAQRTVLATIAALVLLSVATGAMGEPPDAGDSAPAGRQAESHRAGAAAGGRPPGPVGHLGRREHDLLPRSGRGPEGR